MKFLILFFLTINVSVINAEETNTETKTENKNTFDIKSQTKRLDELNTQLKIATAELNLLTTRESISELNVSKESIKNKKPKKSTYVYKPNIKVHAIFDETAVVSIDGSKKTMKKGHTFKSFELIALHDEGVIIKYLKTNKQYNVNF